MTDILCRWLNTEVKLDKTVDGKSFSNEFSNGYLIGEILNKHGLQDDFSSFSKSSTADSKLNNFTRMEPTMALLGVPFDTKVAKDIMNEKPGVATRLIYQLFIALGRKTKMNLTGVAMETMRPAGPAKLSEKETDLYRERLKTLVPRQVDLNFDNLVKKYHDWQKDQEDRALQDKMEEDDKLRKYQQRAREQNLQRSKNLREKQEDTMQKIREATVKIPKPIETKKTSKNRADLLKEKTAKSVYRNLSSFESSLKAMPPPMSPLDMDRSNVDTDIDVFLNSTAPAIDKTFSKPALNNDYVAKIRRRLEEDAKARKEREKRRRRVLVEQLKSHELQEEAHREEMLVNRLMRQSQMERRIAVQLMHVRHEKEVIKKNRMLREEQFTERRLKDFADALDREADLCREAKIEYEQDVNHNIEVHSAIVAEKAKAKYAKRYNICKDILFNIVDFSCKVGEYRELTEKLLPPKLVRDWKALFVEGKPLYPPIVVDEESNNEVDALEEEKQLLLDEKDFLEYKNFDGEWIPSIENGEAVPLKDNVILGHVLHRMFSIVSPPAPTPPPPQFPPCPLKISVIGKFFSGKSTAIQHIVETHRIVSINVDEIVEEALQAFKNKESVMVTEEKESEEQKAIEGNSVDETDAKQNGATEPDDVTAQIAEKEETEKVAEIPITTPVENKHNGSLKSEKAESVKTFGSSHSLKSATSALMFTNRAKLGSKAFTVMKKGKPLPDALLVDIIIEEIRNIPKGTGWILDGFPTTINQAKLLEKALTGNDASSGGTKNGKDSKKTKKSKIVSDPHPSTEVATVKSGLDLVCLFEIDDAVILKRAEGRTYDPSSADVFHQEFDPPPEGSYTGVLAQAKVQPVLDPSNDKEQVQSRLASFQDTLPKLEKWYGKFGVLQKLDAAKPSGDLADEFRTIIEETFQKLNAPPPEETPKDPQDVTEQEPASVEEPKPEVPPEPVPEPPVSPVSETKSVKSTVKGQKPVSPKGSKKAGKKDDRGASPGRKGKKGRSPSPGKQEEKGGRKKASRSPSPKAKGGRPGSKGGSRPGSRGRRSPGKEAEPEVPPEPEGPPEPQPGSPEWEYVAEPLDEELAHVLVDKWNVVENTYIDSAKHVFRNIRDEREKIYRYMYKSRKDFADYLKRPDTKQEFVSAWQKEYNSTADDMRDDEDTKAEMHQQLDDLCERLWNISDTRKEDAEAERSRIMNEGWLEDHVGLLTNHYISLMQGELNRYQDTCKLLKDYYVGMEGGLGPKKAKILPDGSQSFTRIPLVELPTTLAPGEEVEPPPSETKPLSAKASKDKDRDVKTPEQEDDDANKRRIPLVPRRPKSGETSGVGREVKSKKATPRREKTTVSEEKLDSPTPPADPDERLLFDAFQSAILAIEAQSAADIAVEEAESQRHAEQEREREKELMKIHSKDKRSKKRGASPGKNAVQETPTPVQPEENVDMQKEEEEKQRRQKIRERLSKEYKFAVFSESEGLRKRLDNISFQGTSVVQKLKAKSLASYEDMNDWLGQRFLQEMESIDTMAVTVRSSIEKESKIQECILLEDKDLVIEYDLRRFKTPTPPPPPSPKEESKPDTFTVVQLLSLHKQFSEIAPSGLISAKAFSDTILDYASCNAGTEGLPDNWMSVSTNQLQDIATNLVSDNEYLDWKAFLLSAAKPWPPVTVSGLLETLRQFREADDLKIGRVGREDFEKVKMWFSEDEDDLSSYAEDGYNRLKELHYAFFDLFADTIDDWQSVDYVNMLLYFSAVADPFEGFLRALSVVTGSSLPTKEEIDAVEKPEDPDQPVQAVPHHFLTPVVLADILKVFNHSKRFQGDSHRFSATSDPLDSFSEERLTGIYEELGGEADGIPIYLLFQHPVMRDCITQCKKFQQIDLQQLLKNIDSS
ncbi:sperm flagellar protein 2-like [Rhopilema esculentum]|uniref:sperm flagellar protein 2-like n=1 Tax=Rhopilema esculentum TaxID=499914 RepID=UPI0031DB61EF